MSPKTRFDAALDSALGWCRKNQANLGDEVHLVRDIYGRIRLVSDSTVSDESKSELIGMLGAFAPESSSLVIDRCLFSTDELQRDRLDLGRGVWLVDRLVSEQLWRRPVVATHGHRPRLTFFGIKGGVGRSLALVATAKRFASTGMRVLVVDLDLESPGVTGMLLSPKDIPQFGAIDWFVEDAVGQGDDELLHSMGAPSKVAANILVVPAPGSSSLPPRLSRDTPGSYEGVYVAKLGRSYASPDGAEFAMRLEKLLIGLERVYSPHVVLIDSRAGMHDISAAAVPRLGGQVLMFAGATTQTWLAYRLLFSAWGRNSTTASNLRSKLKVVASQVPETGRNEYLASIQKAAFELFSEFLYDPKKNNQDYEPNDPHAPHTPLPIYWRRELVEWEPTDSSSNALSEEQFDAAFGPYLSALFELPNIKELLAGSHSERDETLTNNPGSSNHSYGQADVPDKPESTA